MRAKAAPRLDSGSARGEQLGVDVSFVLRDDDVLGTVEGGDREAAS